LGEPSTSGVPNRQGFDTFFGFLNQAHAHNYYPEHLWENEEMVELLENLGDGRKVYSHDLFTEHALAFIRNHHQSGQAGEVSPSPLNPFFLYLAYTLPHANNERGMREGNGMEVPDLGIYKDRDWQAPEKGRAAMVSRLDRDLGRIMALLDELGIAENTLVFFTSDNGPHSEGNSKAEFFRSSGPLRGTKRALYEGGIRVPCLVRWKGTITPNQVSAHPWAFWDVLPTLADLAGVPSPNGLDGLSMLPLLYGKEAPSHQFFYWEFHEGGFHQAVRMDHWKAVRKGTHGPLELYDLNTDLAEKTNLVEQYPEIGAQIEQYLKTARTESEHWHL
jgi:arylsulfatase A-like enzyme